MLSTVLERSSSSLASGSRPPPPPGDPGVLLGPSRYNRPLALFCFNCLLVIFSEEAWVQTLPPWKFTSVILPWLSRFPGSRLPPSGGEARLPNRQPSQARLACLGTSTSHAPSTSGVWHCACEPDAWHCVLRTTLGNVFNFNQQKGKWARTGSNCPKAMPRSGRLWAWFSHLPHF